MAGLRYVYDRAKPEGARLVDVQIADAGGWFSPLLREASYRVALNSFMGRDGDGFQIRGQGRDLKDSGQAITDIVSDYVKAHSPLAPALDGRIQSVSGNR